MKISNRNYPILDKLNKGSLGKMPIYKDDLPFFNNNIDFYKENWKLNAPYFKQNIYTISESFYKASEKAKEKLLYLIEDIALNDIADYRLYGTFLFFDKVVMIRMEFNKGSDAIEQIIYAFNKDGLPLLFYANSSKIDFQFGWIGRMLSNFLKIKPQQYSADTLNPMTRVFNEWIAQVVIFDLFKSYAQVETKHLPPNSKTKDIDCKYINDTSLPITYLDSKWFTNLVKSDAFKVRGHFRLQPKKENGRWTKELIWINEFTKQGYTSKAKILSN